MRSAARPGAGPACGTLLHRARDLHERRGQRAGAAGDDRGAAVGRELAVAREGEHQEEGDRCRRRTRRAGPRGSSGCRRRPPPPKKKPNCRMIAASSAKKLAMVMISTSRFFTCVSSWAITPSSSLGESTLMIPVVAQTVALFWRAPARERVRHVGVGHGDPRLGQVGLDAEPLDHRVQARRLLRRDLLGAHRGQRELVGEEQLGQRAARRSRPRSVTRPGAGREQHADEDHVEQAQQEQRQQHPDLKTGVPGEDCSLRGHDMQC